jgi:hypothetical protein
MFQSNEGPSFPAHQFLLSGTSAPVGCCDTTGLYQHFIADNTTGSGSVNYFDDSGCIATTNPLATAADVDPSGEEDLDYTPPFKGVQYLGYPSYDHGTLTDLLEGAKLSWRWYGYGIAAGIWNAPDAIQHICGVNPGGSCPNGDWQKHVDLTDSDIFADISSCSLANVS